MRPSKSKLSEVKASKPVLGQLLHVVWAALLTFRRIERNKTTNNNKYNNTTTTTQLSLVRIGGKMKTFKNPTNASHEWEKRKSSNLGLA